MFALTPEVNASRKSELLSQRGRSASFSSVFLMLGAPIRAFPDLRFSGSEPAVLEVSGDLVLWRWRMEGTHQGVIDPPGFAPTGRSMRVEGVDRWVMREGRICDYRAFYDMNEVARQLGIAPAPGSRAERAAVALQRLQARFASR